MKKRYRVETRAIVLRFRYVVAHDEKEAEALSISARITHEEDENEETISIVEELA